MLPRIVYVVAGATLACAPVVARDAPVRPPAIQAVFDCRGITDDKERLACFDTGIAKLDAAQASGDIAMVDREQVRETRRKLFGFTLPSLAIFGSADAKGRPGRDRDDFDEITSTISAARPNSEGMWIITLEDGARWEQTGSVVFGRLPKPGATVVIKRAALGSFKMSIGSSPAVKARRIG